VQDVLVALWITKSASIDAIYKSLPTKANARDGCPDGVPPTLCTTWIVPLPGFSTRFTLPFFKNPTYRLLSGPMATAVG
jgi:hypothetical protein